MKKILILTLAAVAAIMPVRLGLAQTVSVTPAKSAGETPATTPAPKSAAMSLPAQTQAAFLAGQIIQQVTTLLNNVQQVIDSGVPAQENGQPAISAKDIQAALGTENVMRLRSAVAILSGGASPSAAPAPKGK